MTTTALAPATVTPAPRVTPEDMARLPDDGRLYELVDGRLVEKQMSDLAQFVANRLKKLLDSWSDQSGAGDVMVEASFRCFPHDRDMVRRPDVAFVSAGRLAGYAWGQGHFTVVPDLAVEVVSPHDEVYDLDRKIADYFRAGVRRVWVINPEQQTIRVHSGLGKLSELVGDVELRDEEVLPGLRFRLATLFAKPGVPQP